MIRLQEYALEELRNNICCEISTVSGEELQRVNNVFRYCFEYI
jgi:hypothetical protein